MRNDSGYPRDPVTGTPARPPSARERRGERLTPDEIVNRIRETRAEMSGTLDEIEHRISPSTLSDEVRRNVRETVDDLREQINPARMAKRAGDTMFETIKENPLPALAAGLSLGYLVMKAAEGSDEPRRRGAYPAYRDPSAPYSRARYDYERPRYGREGRPWEYDYRYEETRGMGAESSRSFDYERDEDRSIRERVGERAEDLRERAADVGDEVRQRTEEGVRAAKERVEGVAHEVEHRAREAGRYVGRRAVRAERTIEEFVQDNPLVAGLITAGLGALLGAAFPSTRKEDELMGRARDQVVERARDAGEQKLEQAKEAASRIGEDAKRHAQELGEEAKEEVRHLAEDSAERRGDASRREFPSRGESRQASEDPRERRSDMPLRGEARHDEPTKPAPARPFDPSESRR